MEEQQTNQTDAAPTADDLLVTVIDLVMKASTAAAEMVRTTSAAARAMVLLRTLAVAAEAGLPTATGTLIGIMNTDPTCGLIPEAVFALLDRIDDDKLDSDTVKEAVTELVERIKAGNLNGEEAAGAPASPA